MAADTKPRAKRGAVALFAILVLGAATGNLSQTSLNAMLAPVIEDFGVGVDVGQWLTSIYMLALGIAVPLTTFLTKRMSMRAYTLMSLGLFVAGALVDAFAPAFWMLVLGRVLQAVSAGFMMPVMQTVAIRSFAPERQGTAMGIAGIAMGFAPNIGPTIGSLIEHAFGWRAFFMFLAAIPIVLMVVTVLKVKHSDDPPIEARLDIGSFLLSAIGFGGLLTGLTLASTNGFSSPVVLAMIAVGVVVLVVFIRRQSRVEHPLICMDIFKSRHYKAGFWMQNLLFGSFMGITLVIPLYIQGPLGGTVLDSGTVLLPGAVAALIVNPLSGILGDRIGKEKVIIGAAVVYAVGSLLALLFDESTPLWIVAVFQMVRGIGISSSMGCTITWMLGELRRDLVNDGSSFSVLVRQASASLGTAVMVYLVTLLLDAGFGMVAYQAALGFSAVFAVVMLVLVLKSVKMK